MRAFRWGWHSTGVAIVGLCCLGLWRAPLAQAQGGPVAVAGPDQKVPFGTPVTLDGSHSTGSNSNSSAWVNPGFETGNVTGWTLKYGPAEVVTSHRGNYGCTYRPKDGLYLARLGTRSTTHWSELYQSIPLKAGDMITGWAALASSTVPGSLEANVSVTAWLNGNGYSACLWWEDDSFADDYPWQQWTFTAPTTGLYRLSYYARDHGRNCYNGRALFDAPLVVPGRLTFGWREGATVLGTDPVITVLLPLGSHTIRLTVTDGAGRTAFDDVVVTVVDTEPPTGTLEVLQPTLWPPNGKLVLAARVTGVRDNCDPSPGVSVSVTSNEKIAGGVDWQVAPADGVWNIWLRARRDGAGRGRTYDIAATLSDSSGNTATLNGLVTVPHDQRPPGR